MNLKKINIQELYLVAILAIIGFAMHLWGPHDNLDVKFFYNDAVANNFFQGLSSSQTNAYFVNEVLDLFFLSTYSLIFFSLARKNYPRRLWIAFIPGIFDFIETITIMLLLLNRTWTAPIWLGYATSLKWTTGAIVVILIFVGFFRRLKLN